MLLTVLGCYGPYPAAGGACSGYLLQEGNTKVLLECGSGIVSKLRYHCEPRDLDAVVVSHLHGDHVADLYVMRYALLMTNPGKRPLVVYAPAEPAEEFARLSYKEYLQAKPVQPGEPLQIGNMRFYFSAGVHAFVSHVIRIEVNGKVLVFSGDTEYFPGLAEAARDADLFLCEANYLRPDIEQGKPNHLAAYQAAETAKDAGVKKLVLTHHHPEREISAALKEAADIFPAAEAATAGSLYLL